MDRKILKKNQFSFLRLVFNFESFQGGFVGQYLTLLFASPDDLIEKSHFLSEKFRPKPFRNPKEKNVSLSEKLFNLVVKTALYISRGSFWKERIDIKVLYFFLFADFEQTNFSLFAIIFGSGVETAFYVFTGTSWGSMFFKESLHLNSWDFKRDLCTSWELPSPAWWLLKL